jgi:hypothetical protein
MKHLAYLTSVSILLLGLWAGSASGQDLSKEFCTPDGFTLYLPGAWVQVRKEVVDQRLEQIRQRAPKMAQHLDYIFQESQSDEGVSCPYIAIQVIRLDHVSETALKDYKGLKEAVDQESSKAGKLSRALSVENFSLNDPVYDPATHTLWIKGELGTADIQMKCLMGARLTADGLIRVYCYDLAGDFDKRQSLFYSIVNGIVLDKPYIPGNEGSWFSRGLSAVGSVLIILGFIGMTVTVIYKVVAWSRRKAARSAEADKS